MSNLIAMVYVSRTGKTESVARRIRDEIGAERVNLKSLRETTLAEMLGHEVLILGTPTYGMGDLDYRWVKFLEQAPPDAFAGKTVALFALGDQVYHGDTFAGSLKKFASYLRRLGADLVGRWPNEGYRYVYAPALEADNSFPGLVVDEITQADQTAERVRRWTELLKADRRCRALQ